MLAPPQTASRISFLLAMYETYTESASHKTMPPAHTCQSRNRIVRAKKLQTCTSAETPNPRKPAERVVTRGRDKAIAMRLDLEATPRRRHDNPRRHRPTRARFEPTDEMLAAP